ncbi:hypothetical protein HK097_003465 [Rhizophlyctis rosea]|uniref:MICOS complex subunit n=1 Tax=Rhizophlyctis rosea TaxID=64517 RepID=A0AAD5S2B7_9FUNG|nr:hypothetical protein HK097_003465 [Rhizophlyctis rosea]
MSSQPDFRTGFIPPKKKLSIYDDAPEPVPLHDEPSKLELAIRETRHQVSDQFSSTRAQVQVAVDKWIRIEQSTAATVKQYAAPGEPLLPGALYVTVAGFAGSILTKHRALPLRLLAPTGLALGAFAYLYPRTTQNIYTQTKTTTTGPGVTVLDATPKVLSPVTGLADSLKGLFGGSNGTESKEKK